jgi:hypothetical protein
MYQDRQDIRLNFIPIEFTRNTFKGGILPYEDAKQLDELREKYGHTHVFRREGNQVQCVPIEQAAEPLGRAEEFSIEKHFTLASRLAQEALIRLFNSKGYEFCSVFPTTRLVITKEDMMADIFKDVPGTPPLFLHPQYEIESKVIVPHNSAVRFGILLNFSSGLGFRVTVADLVSQGVDVSGRYIVAEYKPDQAESVVKPKYRYALIGKVEYIDGTTAKLSDFRDEQVADCTSCYLEPRSENVVHCLRSLYPKEYEGILSKKREAIFKITGAKHQVDRLFKVIKWLKNSEPIKCSADLSFTLSDRPYAPALGRDAGDFRMLQNPTCVLRPGGSITVNWPVDPHLEDKGPFDAESFPKKKPTIAVIFPRRFKGEVEVFMRQFRDGLLTNSGHYDKFIPYSQGFVRKYRLTGCDIKLRPLDGDSDDARAYRAKCLDVLAEDISYDLAMVVIKESFHLLRGEENPYLIAKSTFMSQGVPVQEIEIETIQEQRSRVYILNNLSVACYAKLGGIPWVLSPAPGLAHELIFGIGSARRSVSRLSPSERLVGITTVFSGDGNYLLSNVSKEVPFEEYQESLLGVLRNNLDQIRKRYAWQPGDKVRMIFHQTFKRYRDAEAAAVKSFVDEISEFDVEYAFVHISRNHSWRIFDLKSSGISHWDNRVKKVKGEFVPWRGCYVPVGHNAALLCVTGPHQLKTHLQGCPEPILISLHRESTFSSLDYVAEQIYKLTFMSWRSFFPASVPVTIFYSDLIANLHGQLGGVPKWNPDMLATKLRESRWFL